MGRRREAGVSLPPYVYLRRKSYYFRSPIPPRKWTPLGNVLAIALIRYAQLIAGDTEDCATIANVVAESQPAAYATFSSMTEWYFREFVPDKSARTQRDNSREITRLLAVFGEVAMHNISSKDVRTYLHERGKQAKTRANREVALLSHIFSKAIEWEIISTANPCAGIPRFAEQARERYVTDEEFALVWSAAAQLLQDALDLALLLGQRPADTLNLTLNNVDSEAIALTQSKTGRKVRIRIEGQLLEVLRRISSRRRVHGEIQLIVNEAGRALTASALRSLFDAARHKAGVSFQFRDLRAKNATDTDDVFLAQQRLAHTTVTTTERYIRRRKGALVAPLYGAKTQSARHGKI
jgi:integrase